MQCVVFGSVKQNDLARFAHSGFLLACPFDAETEAGLTLFINLITWSHEHTKQLYTKGAVQSLHYSSFVVDGLRGLSAVLHL